VLDGRTSSINRAFASDRDGERVTELLFAGSSLDKAKRVFDRWAKHRPRIRMTIRQRTRVLQQRPRWNGMNWDAP
jgi:hypothetical protein